MHVILGMLGSLVTILWLLHRLAEMGIDLGGLNPWLWQRRRRWKKQYEANPIYSLDSPMEATALLLVATAKADGDISSEEKQELLGIFENEFHQSKRDAAGLMISTTHLFGKGDEVRENLTQVLSASIGGFSRSQAESAIELMNRIAGLSGQPTEMQSKLIAEASALLGKAASPQDKWG